MTAAGAEFWDRYFREKGEAGEDLDWGGRWTRPFLVLLERSGVRTVLEVGCGTGHDAARLARAGLDVTAVDVSAEAIRRARERYGAEARFEVADVTAGLPADDATFDAVMANVSLHMFPWSVTRAVFDEVARLLRPAGLFLFHVNAREDRPLRAQRRRVARELEPNYVLEEVGQTVRFFSADDLRALLPAERWDGVELEQVAIRDEATGEPFKVVWRGVAPRVGQAA